MYVILIFIYFLWLFKKIDSIIPPDDGDNKNKQFTPIPDLKQRQNCLKIKHYCNIDKTCKEICFPLSIEWTCSTLKNHCVSNIVPLKNFKCLAKNGGFEILTNLGGTKLNICTCLYPQFYTGFNCDVPNPLLGGKISDDFNALKNKPSTQFLECPDEFFKTDFFGILQCFPNKYKFSLV